MRLALDLNSSLDLDQVLQRVMDDVITLTRAERGFVLLVEESGLAQGVHETSTIAPGKNLSVTSGINVSTVKSQEFHVSRSVIDSVLASSEPLLTSDAQHDNRFSSQKSVIVQKLVSILCVPLKVKDRLQGVIYVDSRVQAGVFTPADLELLTIIAANAAIAIENARLYLETKKRLDALNFLYMISQEISASLDIKRVLRISTESVVKLLGGTAASILTIEGNELVFQVAVGPYAEVVSPFRIPRGKGIAGLVAESCHPLIINDLYQDARFSKEFDLKSGFHSESLVAVPLVVGDRSLGVIEVFNKPGGFSLADQEVLTTLASVIAFSIENARLYAMAIEKGRMERELSVARSVQTSLLPRSTPQLHGWEIATRWLPARQVAGDYYDFIPLHGEMGLVIADVTDKGMPAALFMAFARSTLRASVSSIPTPAEALTHANSLISADSYNSMFVTLLYGALNPETGILTYVNAGHTPPIRVRSQAPTQLTRLGRPSLPMGIDETTVYTQEQIQIEPGEILIAYTDGATDALNNSKQDFGVQRLEKVILEYQHCSAEELAAAIETAIHDFIGGSDQFDDITLMILKRLPKV